MTKRSLLGTSNGLEIGSSVAPLQLRPLHVHHATESVWIVA